MRRIRGLLAWLVLTAFVFGQSAAFAACPMRMAALAEAAAVASHAPCHPAPEAPAKPKAADHGCLCALSCKAIATLADRPSAPAALPAPAPVLVVSAAWVDALHSLDPPVPRAAA